MDPVLKKAYEAARKGQSFAFATLVETTKRGTPRKTGAKMAVLSDGTIAGSIGGGRNEKAAIAECLKAIQKGQPKTVTYDYFGQEGQSICGGQMKVFIEPFAGARKFIICGGGHIGLPLSVLGKMLNFHVTIIDNRKTFAAKKRFPHADKVICADYVKALAKVNIDPDTYVMIVTQGNEHDFQCLRAVIASQAAYIGVISSKAKRIKFFKRLKKENISDKALKRIDIPAGIDIGAQTPEEISISIAAKLVGQINRDQLKTAKFQAKKS